MNFARDIDWLLQNTTTRDQMFPALVNMRDKLVVFEEQYEKLLEENEKLRAIVNLMELTKERDELKSKVAELESKP